MSDFADYYLDIYPNSYPNNYPLEEKSCVFKGAIVGVSFPPCPNHLHKLYQRSLEPEIFLKHTPVDSDPYGVAVQDWRGNKLGWIPKAKNRELLEIGLDRLRACFDRYNLYDDKAVGMTIHVERKV